MRYQELPRLALEAGMLRPGDILSSATKIDLQAEITEDGSFILNAWPRPMSLSAVTAKAHEIEVWGHVPFVPKLRRKNPLLYWTYSDAVTMKTERLRRMADLLDSSLDFKSQWCEICEIDHWNAVDEPLRADVMVSHASKPFRLVVAPVFHFTNKAQMPSRDLIALETEVVKQVSIGMKRASSITVREASEPTGHFHYELQSQPDFAW